MNVMRLKQQPIKFSIRLNCNTNRIDKKNPGSAGVLYSIPIRHIICSNAKHLFSVGYKISCRGEEDAEVNDNFIIISQIMNSLNI
jgi:hypothetical protein